MVVCKGKPLWWIPDNPLQWIRSHLSIRRIQCKMLQQSFEEMNKCVQRGNSTCWDVHYTKYVLVNHSSPIPNIVTKDFCLSKIFLEFRRRKGRYNITRTAHESSRQAGQQKSWEGIIVQHNFITTRFSSDESTLNCDGMRNLPFTQGALFLRCSNSAPPCVNCSSK